MGIKRIRQFKKFVLLFVLVHVFCWLAVPLHLQNINRCSASDVCNEINATYSEFHRGKAVPKLHILLKHDENDCPICTLAQNKILSDATKSQTTVVAIDWLLLYREEVESLFSASVESIRAPPVTSLLS